MNGLINVNKSVGVSSAREVAIIKRLTNTPCGHMGTLDPMASGVLPIGIGNACRLFDYFLDKHKIYEATFDFGVEYDTLDTTGELVSDGGYVPSEREIKDALPSLCGEVMQVPPAYSAKNINGKRAYQLARAGVEVSLQPKKVQIFSVELTQKVAPYSYKFLIECGSGTYVRSLGRDLAALLGTHAAMSALVRKSSGIFNLESSVKTENLYQENIGEYIVPTDSVLPFASVYPQGNRAKKLFNGLSAEYDLADGTYKIYQENGDFYGLATAKDGYLKVRTKLC
ncbi:MAG: tRNA pseudouridine(55) synthase TruB [Candidatus Coproplasma sp.]